MSEPVYISWNFPNWVTIVLMVAIGMAVVGAVSSFVRTNIATV